MEWVQWVVSGVGVVSVPANTRLSSVVFPDPRKPVTTVTGSRPRRLAQRSAATTSASVRPWSMCRSDSPVSQKMHMRGALGVLQAPRELARAPS